jgi:hypothetical protein
MVLPYQVITGVGPQARFQGAGAFAPTTPATASEASANVGQQVTLTGAGYSTNATKVTLEAINQDGLRYILTLTPDSVAADGASLVFTVPAEARTGIASILNGGSGTLLQIVPRVTSIAAVLHCHLRFWLH